MKKTPNPKARRIRKAENVDGHTTPTDRHRFSTAISQWGIDDASKTLPRDPYSHFLVSIIEQGLADLRNMAPDSREALDWLAWFIGCETDFCTALHADGHCYHMSFREICEWLGYDRDATLSRLAARLRCRDTKQLRLC